MDNISLDFKSLYTVLTLKKFQVRSDCCCLTSARAAGSCTPPQPPNLWASYSKEVLLCQQRLVGTAWALC